MDFLLNGMANGSVASLLLQNNFDVSGLRPYIGQDGRAYITMNEGGKLVAKPVFNTAATLRYEDWKHLDAAIVGAARPRLKAVADLRASGLQYVIPNGMGVTVFQTETSSDLNDASITMDGIEQQGSDRPEFELTNLPLPIIHKDFHFSARQLAASRNGGSPLDTSTAETAARKVAETAEKLLIGTTTTNTFGGGSVYGYTTFPSRITQTITSPVAGGWTAATTVSEVLAMIKLAIDAYHYGPFRLYFGPSWSTYMNDEYKDYSNDTLAQRLARIDAVQSVQMLDYLTGYDIILVQMTSDVAREVIGMDITTVQWETLGGMQVNFKVMAILVPQIRADFSGNAGIVHGSV